VGVVGQTGRATNTHLHFEVRRNRLPQNPLLFLPAE
jgi:murein DD-endopeptidase MepM/ murein hydrolase activator NlpD